MEHLQLITPRLKMRSWQPRDREPFFAINCEPAVYQFLGPLTRDKSDAMIDRANANFEVQGWGRWALEERESGCLIGHCGLMPVLPEVPVEPGVEVSWRLSERWQGKGLAREAAEAALRHGFDVLGFERVLSYTTPPNTASWGLMERLGMTFVREFANPNVAEGHPLRLHLLYELRRAAFREV